MTRDEVVEHKVRRATAFNALHKISGIVGAEQKIDASKARYTRWFLRYGIVLLLLVCAVLVRFLGVI
jgi:hypothetical protein